MASEYQVIVDWKGGMEFQATPQSGNIFVMDAHPDFGGQGNGPSPVEALLGAIAGCSAMDVVSILQKMKQKVTSYRVEVDGERGPNGVYPRPFVSITVRHFLKGENLDEAAVAKAVSLSDDKYCTVISTLRMTPKVLSEFVIE